MKYFDDPVYDSKFNQFIDLLAQLIEKYGGEIVFPSEENHDRDTSSVSPENSTGTITNQHVA